MKSHLHPPLSPLTCSLPSAFFPLSLPPSGFLSQSLSLSLIFMFFYFTYIFDMNIGFPAEKKFHALNVSIYRSHMKKSLSRITSVTAHIKTLYFYLHTQSSYEHPFIQNNHIDERRQSKCVIISLSLSLTLSLSLLSVLFLSIPHHQPFH